MKIASNRMAAAAVVACLVAFGAAPAGAESAVGPLATVPWGPAWADALIQKGKSGPGAKRAECKDGSFSFTAHHRAKACAHHGGVVRWL